MAGFFAFAAPAMAAAPTFDQATPLTVEADGPDGWDLHITASDDTDPVVAVTCAPALGTVLPIGGPHAVSCTATDDSADPAPNNTVRNYQITVTDTARSDLAIDKFASVAKASPGQHITYTFSVKNNGPNNATGVTVRDPLSAHFNFISGDPGCTVTSGELVCVFGNINNGATATKNVVLQLHPSHHQGEAPNQHQLDIIKVENSFSVPGNALNYPEFSLTCPDGYTATDGSARISGVDQNSSDQPGVSHEVERVHFVRSENRAADQRVWDFTLQNHTSGQGQGHLYVVCLRDHLAHADGHQHALLYGPRQSGTLNIPPSGGRREATLTCPPGHVAVAPSFEFVHPNPATPPNNPGDKNGPHGPQYKSEQSPDGASWTWGFQTAAAASVELSIRCLNRYTNSVNGHTETLNFHHVYGRANVAPFQGFGNSGPWTEARAECPVHYKGITATWRYPRHVIPLGNEPQPINRDFRIFNKSNLTKWARIDLNCLKITTRDDLNGGSIRNTASVYGNQPDWVFGNNIDFFDLEDPPLEDSGAGSGDGGGSGGSGSGGSGSGGSGSGGSGGGGTAADSGKQSLRLGNAVTHAGKTAMVPLHGGDDASSGNVAVDAGNRRLGASKFALDAGEDDYVEVNLSKKERKILRKRSNVDVTVYSGGSSSTQTLRVIN